MSRKEAIEEKKLKGKIENQGWNNENICIWIPILFIEILIMKVKVEKLSNWLKKKTSGRRKVLFKETVEWDV